MYLQKSKKIFQEWSVSTPQLVASPCSERDIQALEQSLQVKLPASYREFLFWIGNGAGRFLGGIDIFYKHIPDIQEGARELLEEDGGYDTLPIDAFIFMMNQGYQFAYFLLSDGDDPKIYYYKEGEKFLPEEPHYPNLDEFVLSHINRSMKYY